MFFSQAILSKRGPLAKVWLASHYEKKLSKREVVQTNIETSIGAIIQDGKEPKAIRLTGQLLLGVVRIYSRKARYLLEDCNEAKLKLQMAFRPGVVDMPEDHAIAALNTITLPDVITEFDIMLPDPDFNFAWSEEQSQQSQVTLSASSNRIQEITIPESYTTPRRSTLLLTQPLDNLEVDVPPLDFGFDDEQYLDKDYDADASTSKRPKGSGGIEQSPDVEIEVGRDAQQEQSVSFSPRLGLDGFKDLDESSRLSQRFAKSSQDNLLAGNEEAVDLFGGMDDLMDLDLPRAEVPDAYEPPMDEYDAPMDLPFEDDLNASVQDNIMFNTPLSERSLNVEEPERVVTAAQKQKSRVVKRKRTLIIDNATELSNRAMQAQLKDTSDIRTKPSFVPSSITAMQVELQCQDIKSLMEKPSIPGLPSQLQDFMTFASFRRSKHNMNAPSNVDDRGDHNIVIDEVILNEEAAKDVEAPVPDETTVEQDLIGNEYQAPDVNDYPAPDMEYVDEYEAPGYEPDYEPGVLDESAGGNVSMPATESGDVMIPAGTEVEGEAELDQPSGLVAADTSLIDIFSQASQLPVAAKPIDMNDVHDEIQPLEQEVDEDREDDDEGAVEGGFSKNTIQAIKLLKTQLNGKEKIEFRETSAKAKRSDAAKFFFELLVLKTRDMVDLKQSEAFGDISISATERLFEQEIPAR